MNSMHMILYKLIYSLLFMEYVCIIYNKIETEISALSFSSDILGSNIS